VAFDSLGELHVCYLKGLPGPYCIASAAHDEEIRRGAPGLPISEEAYHAGVEAVAGNCRCGGSYRLNAPVRCPRCRSTRIEEGETSTMYD
jgi:hypothetical protein